MVQDARVSRQLARLGGVYRDPARVNRDASTLLKSSVGQHLNPIAAVYTDDKGDSTTVLVLQGTIAIHFRGNTYQLLIDIYLIPTYPNRPPICYVRLAPNMYLKENHKHCGSDGKIYLPYLHEWRPNTHNLVELTVAISSVFSADPPVFSRSTKPPTTATATAAATPSYSAATMSGTSTTSAYGSNTYRTDPPPFSHALNNSYSATTTSNPTTSATSYTTTSNVSNSWRDQQQQLEAMMAQEAAEANAAAEAARRAEREEQERMAEAEAYERAQLKQAREAVIAKIQSYCHEQANITQQLIQDDAADQEKLELTENSIKQQIDYLRTKKAELKNHCDTVDASINDIKIWIDKHENIKNEKEINKVSIDEICVGDSIVHQQQLDLAAENAAISDALYFLDCALYNNQLTATQHLKQVRSLAKQQFLIRAHLLKIQQILSSQQLLQR